MKKPRIFSVQLTEGCNLACRYCYVRERIACDRKASHALCRDFVDFALNEAEDRLEIVFFGGEPLLCMDLIRYIVEYARPAAERLNKGVEFILITNGTMLSGSTASFLAAEGIAIQVSLDGPPEVQDSNRPQLDGSGSFTRVYQNLVDFRATHPAHPLFVNAVLMDGEALPWLSHLKDRLHLDDVYVHHAGLSAKKEQDLGGHSLVQIHKAYRRRLAIHYQQFVNGEQPWDQDISEEIRTFLFGFRRSCNIAYDQTLTTQSGQIYPCSPFAGDPRHVIGDVTNGLIPEKVGRYTDRFRDPQSPCPSCPIFRYCGGGCHYVIYQRTGTLARPDPEFCGSMHGLFGMFLRHIIRLAARRPESFLFDLVYDSTMNPVPLLGFLRNAGRHASSNLKEHSHDEEQTGRFVLRLDAPSPVPPAKPGSRPRLRTDHLLHENIARFVCSQNYHTVEFTVRDSGTETDVDAIERVFSAIARETTREGISAGFRIELENPPESLSCFAKLVEFSPTISLPLAPRMDAPQNGRGRKTRRFLPQRMHDDLARFRREASSVSFVAELPSDLEPALVAPVVSDLTQAGFESFRFVPSFETCSPTANSRSTRETVFRHYLRSALAGGPVVDTDFASLVAETETGTAAACVAESRRICIDSLGDVFPSEHVISDPRHRLGNCRSLRSRFEQGGTSTDLHADCPSCWIRERCPMRRPDSCQSCAGGQALPDEPANHGVSCTLLREEFARATLARMIVDAASPDDLKPRPAHVGVLS